MSLRDQAVAEERALRQALRQAEKVEPYRQPAEAKATLGRLREKADRVIHLRSQAAHEDAYRVAERRGALRERIEEEQAKEKERKAREPGRKALRILHSFADAELRNVLLDAGRLSVEECTELLTLVEARADGTISDRKRKHLHRLIGIAADDPDLFSRAAKERAAEERQAAEQKQARLDAMPLRRFEGKGGVYLPAYLFSWLTSTDEGSLNVTDIAILAVVVMAIEHGRSPFARSEFVDGAIVIDDATGFALRPCMNPAGEVGERQVRDAIAYLAGNDWLDIGKLDGRTTVSLGERARKLLEEATTRALP